MSGCRVAVDVGGTFIDVAVADGTSGAVRIAKVLHRLGRQGEDIAAAIEALLAADGRRRTRLDSLVIGTTVVTNALLEGKLARTALVSTAGFKDVIEIARMTRPAVYDPHRRRATPVVASADRFDVAERLAFDGEVLQPLDPESVMEAVRQVEASGVEAVAVCLLYSYVDPSHERSVGAALAALGLPVSLSSEVLPVFREYERGVATAVNAATVPVMGRFLDGLAAIETGGAARIFVMGSGGGSLTLPEARRFPIKAAMSGPAGGVAGAARVAAELGLDHLVTLDVGGTSTDIAMLSGGAVPFTDERSIGGYPIAVPSVEVETIGAGGGSIAFIDPTGLLKVGPRSAGAEPGPACYGRGGTEPTVTDAHLALNRLGANAMLSGAFRLDRDAGLAAIRRVVAEPLEIDVMRAARGILQIATANMVRAVRSLSIERGHDPRELSLLAFGGAGPLHALDVARAIGIPTVIVPPHAGIWSAYGILSVETQYATQKTWLRPFDATLADALAALLDDVMADLTARAAADGLAADGLVRRVQLDLRVKGQSHHLVLPLEAATPAGITEATSRFHAEHQRRYSHAFPDLPLDVVNVRATVTAPQPAFRATPPAGTGMGAPRGRRRVWCADEAEPVDVPVYAREDLGPGAVVMGPAVVEQYDTTVVLDPGDRLRIASDGGAIFIDVGSAAPGRPMKE